eukprot:ctg_1604.g301
MRRGNTRQARARSDALRARWHHQRGDVTTAETLYGTCLQHGVESAVARYALARLLLARGEYAQAADEWARVMPQLELATSGALRDGNRDEAAGLEATALWGVALAMASRAPDITETARDTLGQQAVQVLNRVPLAALPDDACICLAQLVELREPQRGCDLYRAVLARRPDDALLWNNVAALSARDGALSAAMDAMREAVRAVVPEMPPSDAVAVVSALLREPEHVTMAYNYARLWEMDGALSAAERLFEAIHRTYSAYVDAALRLGVLAERYRRDLAAAERYFRAAVPHPQAVFALAFLFQAQGRVEDAQQWFEYFVHHRDEWKKVTSSSSGGARLPTPPSEAVRQVSGGRRTHSGVGAATFAGQCGRHEPAGGVLPGAQPAAGGGRVLCGGGTTGRRAGHRAVGGGVRARQLGGGACAARGYDAGRASRRGALGGGTDSERRCGCRIDGDVGGGAGRDG